MKKYKYTAVNLEKKKFTGVFLAEDEEQLAQRLAEQHLYLVKCKVMTATTANVFFSTGKVTTNELASFCRQFAIMITTGISIVKALEILESQSYSDILRKTLEFIYEDVKGGQMLSQALERHHKIFPRFFRSMVYVGEISGALDKILVTLADYFESDARIKKQVKSAMIYPIILITLAIGIVILMCAFIIPTFMDALSGMNVDMPPITLALNDISIWFNAHWRDLLLYIALFLVLFFIFINTKKGKYYWNMFLMKAPLIGKINTALITARFARSFGLLIDGGSDVVDALETVQAVIDNYYVSERMKLVVQDVRRGTSLTLALEAYKLFPTLIIQMISVGEQTGNLSEVLLRSCPFFDNEAESTITNMTSVLQPVILGFIGGVVGVLFYAVYSPLLQIMTTIGV